MRSGTASSRGAITILNAIPTGIGAALGITLQTDARVDIQEGKPSISVKMIEKDENDALAKECVKLVFDLAGENLQTVRVTTRSSIPISRGLKSSSAAANAISLATARALNKKVDDIELVKLGVEAARRAGVTVTGAFDDASACYFGGIYVTDNSKMEVLRREPIPKDKLRVIIHVPDRKIRKKGITKETFQRWFSDFKKAEKLALDGEYFEAMTLNGRLVAKALSIDDSVCRAALKAGALAAGISGTGPATAIIVDESKFEDVLDAVSMEQAPLLIAHPNDTPAPEVIPRLLE
jgi:shikimate kinase